ncbi:rod shape-determining protein MreC [bacterium]|nr:rod shape-determining protein MreC [bacterium]
MILLAAVGLSLTLLFIGKEPSVAGFKRDAGTFLALAAKPVVLVLRTFDLWHENTILRERAVRLAEENADLRDAALENRRLRDMLGFRERFPLPLVSAEVTGHPGASIGGRLLIDVGRASGVQVNSAVLTPQGLVGKVIEVGDHSALVQTIVGNAYGVSVLIERSRVAGILRWVAPGQWTIVGLSTGEDVRRGDVVLTTGAGAVFPKNIRVGVITRVEPPSDPAAGWCFMKPFVRFKTLEEVFVIAPRDERPASGDGVIQKEPVP